MPEGAELKVSRGQLQQLVGTTVVSACVGEMGRYRTSPPIGFGEIGRLAASTSLVITAVEVKGKFMWWEFTAFGDTKPRVWMHCTYGMSGQWTSTASFRHAAFVFNLLNKDTGNVEKWWFRDQRHFGTVSFVFSEAEHKKKLDTIGPDMLQDPGFVVFQTRLLRHYNKTLPQVLMNQSIISGVGNYVKAEALYAAGLSPHRTVGSLSDSEMRNLHIAVVVTLQNAYHAGGASILTYKNVDGTDGQYTFTMQCYGRATDDAGHHIIKEDTLDKRTTHWCPEVQK